MPRSGPNVIAGNRIHLTKHRSLAAFPAITLALILLPVVAGFAGTLLPAIGYWPALGADQPSLRAWSELLNAPGFFTALAQSIWIGWFASIGSVLLAALAVAGIAHRPISKKIGAWISPLLAMPHSALAVGFAFLILPSGWLARFVSPSLTGWASPPDITTVGHSSGWPLVVALWLKEIPYLMLMILGTLNQLDAANQISAARALGYSPTQAWVRVVMPQVVVLIRLPIFAVLAFSLSVVDVALILGPTNPPTLAALAVRWFFDPDPRWIFPACAAAITLFALVVGSIAVAESLLRRLLSWIGAQNLMGMRTPMTYRASQAVILITGAAATLAALAMVSVALWSFAAQWRWPSSLPTVWTIANWEQQSARLAGPLVTTLVIAVAASVISLVLALGWLEGGQKGQSISKFNLELALYVPLLVPQVAFLLGLQVLLVWLSADGKLWAVIWCHFVFVFPYLFLSLADSWRHFDTRYERTAYSLGASPWRVFWQIKLPLLKRPVLIALAVAFAVSIGQYLPTLFAGSGRVATLTTEAVTLASGADRRVIGVWALLQLVLPCAVYAAAALWPEPRK